MSASTAPATAPEPSGTPGTTTPNTPAPGLLASMLAPVTPARTAAFSLGPQTADGTPATGAALPAEGLSSADLHGSDGTQKGADDTSTGNGSVNQPKSVVRAWLLAGAARWARGGGTQNKRLDMKKARAMAHQVKEARTVNSGPVTTTSAGGRGNSTSGAGGSKSLDSKSPKGGNGSAGTGSAKGPKNQAGTGGGAGRGPSGRDTNRSTDRTGSGDKPKAGSGSGGRGTPGPSPTGPKGNTAPAPKPTPGDHNRTPKPSKGDTNSPKSGKDNRGGTTPGGKGGGQGAAGPPGKSGASSTKNDKPTTAKDTKPPAGKGGPGSTKPAPQGNTADKTTGTDTAGKHPKLSLLKRKNTTKQTQPTPADKQPKATPDKVGSHTKPNDPKTGKPFTTRPARETGYRDGTRAAQATAHVKAYRDGLKDGYTDTTEAAQRDKDRLDKAHADRKAARQETPVTLTTSTDQPTTGDPTPIPVDHLSSTHVFLGEGAHRSSMTRGEVRSLKGFERRLEEQAARLDARAEQSRGLKAHADAQAKDAGRLLEAARSAEAGDKYIGTLTRLQEAAQVQATKAEEIYKRSLRGAEHCRTTLNNVQARYGGIYQAVIDSPETKPAELDFYKG
ncbi:hypothetical protein ACFV6B_12865 [Streptomyces microflavus]|uniref:hypothetical protein n=1 Tax=Streptomyces microflavus TaxID=1919 RepID=UPI00364C66C2